MIFNGAKSEMPRGDNGFSLIELLIVVAIILIIAAIAIPNLIRAKIAANEASATNSIRSINTAEFAYNSTYSNSWLCAGSGQSGGSGTLHPDCGGSLPARQCAVHGNCGFQRQEWLYIRSHGNTSRRGHQHTILCHRRLAD